MNRIINKFIECILQFCIYQSDIHYFLKKIQEHYVTINKWGIYDVFLEVDVL